MTNQDYTSAFTTGRSPMEVYNAINDVRAWWTGDIEGDTKNIGDEFTYRYQDLHYSKQRVAKLIPGEKVVWEIPEGSINFVEDKSEWNGTKVIFDISEKDGLTQLTLTHQGLNPTLECFKSCSGGWNHYFAGSLRDFIG